MNTSAPATIIGTVEFTASAKRYLSDGTVLRNDGYGWRASTKLKTGLDPQAAYENAQAHRAAKLARTQAAAYGETGQ